MICFSSALIVFQEENSDALNFSNEAIVQKEIDLPNFCLCWKRYRSSTVLFLPFAVCLYFFQSMTLKLHTFYQASLNHQGVCRKLEWTSYATGHSKRTKNKIWIWKKWNIHKNIYRKIVKILGKITLEDLKTIK